MARESDCRRREHDEQCKPDRGCRPNPVPPTCQPDDGMAHDHRRDEKDDNDQVRERYRIPPICIVEAGSSLKGEPT